MCSRRIGGAHPRAMSGSFVQDKPDVHSHGELRVHPEWQQLDAVSEGNGGRVKSWVGCHESNLDRKLDLTIRS